MVSELCEEMNVVPSLGQSTRQQSAGKTSYSEKGDENAGRHSCGEKGDSKTGRSEERTRSTICEKGEWDQCQ